MSGREVVVLSAVRSAIGTFGGGLSHLEPADLATPVLAEAVRRAAIAPEQVRQVVVGNILPTEPRYAYLARVAAIQAGLPSDSVAMTVNRLCSSGLQAVISTAMSILLGDCDFGVAGGVEVMSRGTYQSTGMRWGTRMGDAPFFDGVLAALTDPFGVGHMGNTAENLAAKWDISREAQDELAVESHRRAVAAIEAGRFKEQILPLSRQTKQGEVIFDTDEPVRPGTNLEVLAKLKPAFKPGGSVTAGNSPGLNDGAAFLVLGDRSSATEAGAKPLARLVSYAVAGVPSEIMGEGPIPATKMALQRAGLTLEQIAVIESNEAFAAQALTVIKALGFDTQKVNPNGGAIALGHPVGASGAVLATKAIYELHRTQTRYALVTLCVGGGQGIAAIFERI